jgi:polysaccharide biosynthesis transport protein
MPNVLMNLQKRLDSMTQQILSRTRLQRFIEDFNLYASERRSTAMDDVIDLMHKRVKVELVQTTTGRNADLTGFKVNFTDRDPYVAQRVTNELTSLFIEQDARERTSQSQRTTQFLDSQMQEAGKQLATEEEKVREYKLKHLGELPSQQTSNLQILTSLEAQLQANTSALDRAEQQRIYLESMRSQQEALKYISALPAPADPAGSAPAATTPVKPDSTAPQPSAAPKPAATSLELARATLAGLWRHLNEISSKYTDMHPEVVRLKKEVSDWEAAVQRLEKEKLASAEVDSRLKATLAEIENGRRESEELRRRIRDVQAQLGQTPVREQELAELTRQHENAKANYQSLLQKKMGSELASNLEERQAGERFRLLDPASLPKKPEGRSKIVLIGWVLAFGAGAAAMFLRQALDRSVHTPMDLEPYQWVPVLARIPTLRTAADELRLRRRHRLEAVAVAAMVLIALASGAHTYLQG